MAGGEGFEFLGFAAGPIDDHALDFVLFAQTKSDGQFGLRKIAGAAVHHARLRLAVVEDAHIRADGVAIGFRADQTKADAAIARGLIVAEKICGPVVGGHQNVEIAVAIEISESQATPYF